MSLTPRETGIQQSLQSQGWTVEWRGVPSDRWLWASKNTSTMGRSITCEVTQGGTLTFFRGQGSTEWLAQAATELKEAMATGDFTGRGGLESVSPERAR